MHPTRTEPDPSPDLTETTPVDASLVPNVADLAGAIVELERRTHDETRSLYIGARIADFKKKFTAENIYVAPADAEQRFRNGVEQAYTEQRGAEAFDILRGLREAESRLSALAQDAERLRSEAEVLPRSASRTETLLSRLVGHFERLAAEQIIERASLPALRRQYEVSSDARDRAFIVAVEAAFDGHRLPAPEGDVDLAEFQKLTSAIRSRRQARVPASVRQALNDCRAIKANSIRVAWLQSVAEGRKR